MACTERHDPAVVGQPRLDDAWRRGVPPCLAASPTPGTGLPLGPRIVAVSPMTKMFGMAGHREVGLDLDPSGAVGGDAEPLRSGR